MKKCIHYHLHTRINRGTDDAPNWEDILTPVVLDWNEKNEEIAKLEAHNGTYSIADSDIEETQPSTIESRLQNIEQFIGSIKPLFPSLHI